MSDMKAIASSFFEACETGRGWDSCKDYCLEDASFSSHAAPHRRFSISERFEFIGLCQ